MAQLEADYKARQNGTHITYPKVPCCPSMTSNPSNLAYPYSQQQQQQQQQQLFV